MAIKKVVLSDNRTGDKIYPRTSYDNLDDIPSNLLTDDYLNVGASDTQQPTLGQDVNSLSSWSSRTINLNGFKLYFFTGFFSIKKDMLLTDWHSDKRVLFFLPQEILGDNANPQTMNAYIKGQTLKSSLIFRTFDDNNSVSFEDFSQAIDLKSIPDSFDISLSGMINSKI
ncbi:hypothetical protein BN20_019 [Lactobacillus phage EV3]|nr:hypothetical protein BN20_019 [Lactobacillus phage EV3]